MWTLRRSNNTKNRSFDDHRTPFERDNTRVIHSAAFRRLQRKTQILGTDEGDFHRTRLTHSLEVASIAKSLVRNLRVRHPSLEILPSDDLISAISLLHDIGHPPFGHGGEVALNYSMREAGGFEGNGQTIRLVTKIENTYGEHGLDLTRRTLLGILKYPSSYSTLKKITPPDTTKMPIRINDWLPPKCYLDSEQLLIDWILEPLSNKDRDLFQTINRPKNDQHGKTHYQSLDCSIMNIADDIAYGVHDFEDAIYLKLIQRSDIDSKAFESTYDKANHRQTLPAFSDMLDHLFNADNMLRKNAIGSLVNFFVTQTHINQTPEFNDPLLIHTAKLTDVAKCLLSTFKDIIYKQVIDSPEARTIEYGGQTVVLKLFEAIESNPLALLNLDSRKKYQLANNEIDAKRQICDHIANMTDEYAYRMHERLFGFNTRTVFERL
jgi:dGTPase